MIYTKKIIFSLDRLFIMQYNYNKLRFCKEILTALYAEFILKRSRLL